MITETDVELNSKHFYFSNILTSDAPFTSYKRFALILLDLKEILSRIFFFLKNQFMITETDVELNSKNFFFIII
jgi:hypothetical protein